MATLCICCLLHSPLERSNQHSKHCSIVVIIYVHRIMSIRFLKIISNPVYLLPPQFVCNICEVQNILHVRAKNSLTFLYNVPKLAIYLISLAVYLQYSSKSQSCKTKYRYQNNNSILLRKICSTSIKH